MAVFFVLPQGLKFSPQVSDYQLVTIFNKLKNKLFFKIKI